MGKQDEACQSSKSLRHQQRAGKACRFNFRQINKKPCDGKQEFEDERRRRAEEQEEREDRNLNGVILVFKWPFLCILSKF